MTAIIANCSTIHYSARVSERSVRDYLGYILFISNRELRSSGSNAPRLSFIICGTAALDAISVISCVCGPILSVHSRCVRAGNNSASSWLSNSQSRRRCFSLCVACKLWYRLPGEVHGDIMLPITSWGTSRCCKGKVFKIQHQNILQKIYFWQMSEALCILIAIVVSFQKPFTDGLAFSTMSVLLGACPGQTSISVHYSQRRE